MAQVSVRHSIVTDRDVEKLETHWSLLDRSSFVLKNVAGFHETRMTLPIPTDTNELFDHIRSLRLVSRNEKPIGDLFFSDAFPGLTIELETELDTRLAQNLKIYSYLEILTGLKFTDKSVTSNAFVSFVDRLLFYHRNFSERALIDTITRLIPAASIYLEDADFLEVKIEPELARWSLRAISALSNSLTIKSTDSSFRTEVGLLQRQNRTIEDSEFKGLSGFFPADDLG